MPRIGDRVETVVRGDGITIDATYDQRSFIGTSVYDWTPPGFREELKRRIEGSAHRDERHIYQTTCARGVKWFVTLEPNARPGTVYVTATAVGLNGMSETG